MTKEEVRPRSRLWRRRSSTWPVHRLRLAVVLFVCCTCWPFIRWACVAGDSSGTALPSNDILPARDLAGVYNPDVRVNLSSRPTTSIRLSVSCGGSVWPVGGSAPLWTFDRLNDVEVTVGTTGLRIGNREFLASRLELRPDESPAIWVGDHQYRGRVRLYRRPKRRLIAVNVVPLRQYLASVVDSEMPMAFPTPARRAQAVVARTYALFQMQAGHPRFDVHASTRSQKYLGFQYRQGKRRLAGESASSRKIVEDTAGVVCTFQGHVFCTYYSAVCGGHTTTGRDVFRDAAPPLRSVQCDWCEKAKLYRWERRIKKQAVQQNLARYFRSRGTAFESLRKISKKATTSPTVLVSDGRRERQIAAPTFRREIAPTLPSPHFSLVRDGREVVVSGRGHGHGVGLCQWGAAGQGEKGRRWHEIVRYYYPGCDLVALSNGAE